MKIFVKVKSTAKKESVGRIDKTHFVVSVKEPPVKGMANKAVVKALSSFFNISPGNIFLSKGATSNQKIFEIYYD